MEMRSEEEGGGGDSDERIFDSGYFQHDGKRPYRGYDVQSLTKPLDGDARSRVASLLFCAASGNRTFLLTNQQGPKIVPAPDDGEEISLVGLQDVSKNSEYYERFSAIVSEIVDLFYDVSMQDAENVRQQLRSSTGFSVSLDSLKNKFGGPSSSTLEDLPLENLQRIVAEDRNAYCILLAEKIAESLTPKLRSNDVLKAGEQLVVAFIGGDRLHDRALSAHFKIV